tara:strand:- start:196 stop:576 length:381 start_codon:yes stop_codon:yes gene_type:complete
MMKLYTILQLVFWAALGLVISFLVTGTAQAEWNELKTEADFDKYLVGKIIEYEKCNLVLEVDGKLTGMCKGVSKVDWEVKNGMFCREGYIGKTKIAPSCQKFEVHGKKLKITSDYGKGKSRIWMIK